MGILQHQQLNSCSSNSSYKYYELQQDLVSLFFYLEKNGQEFDETYLDKGLKGRKVHNDHDFLFRDFLNYIFDQDDEQIDNLLNSIK